MSRPVPLPPPLPVRFPLRDVEPSRTSIQRLPRNRVRMTIDHAPLRGITPEMVLWWFRNIGGELAYGDDIVPRYRAWHPLDHISWRLAREAPGGGAGEGARFHIVEAFGRDPDMLVDTVDTVEKLDATGIRLVFRILGVQVFQLEHTWSRADGATHYTSVFDLGARARMFAPVNAFIRARLFRPEMDAAWIRHNVEEVGLLEHLLPELVAPDGTPCSEPAAATARRTRPPG